MIVTFWKSKLTDSYLESLGLNERQRKAIKYIKENKKITSTEYAMLFKVTERTARNDLRVLITKKVIKKKVLVIKQHIMCWRKLFPIQWGT